MINKIVGRTSLIGSSPRSIAEAISNGGKILQVQSALKTDTETFTTEADITGLSVAITPRDAASQFFVFFTGVCSHSVGGSGTFTAFFLNRNGSNIALGDAASNRVRVTSAVVITTTIAQLVPVSIVWVDSPASAAAVTYKIRGQGSGGNGYLGRSGTDTDSNQFVRMSSALVVAEIGA